MIKIKKMKKLLFNKLFLSALSLLMIISLITSCTKDSLENSGQVVLESFGPTGAKHGENIIFIGQNLDKVTAIKLAGAEIDKAGFIEQTSEKIVFVVPASAVQGYATLMTPAGDIVSKTMINFEVPVIITSMTKEARPGENITIKGEYLNWIKEIVFNKDMAETTFVSQSLNELVVKIPLNAQTGTLIISSGGTEPLTFETDSILIVTLPAVTAMSPNPVLHAANLTITGTNLDLTKEILFTGVSAPVTNFVSQSATQIVVKVPGSTQKGKLTLVANSDVKVESNQELNVVLPAITSMAPNPVAPLSDLTITGTNLNLVTGISFTGIVAPVTSFVSKSATKIVITVPDGTLKGKIVLSVVNSSLSVESGDVLDLIGGLPPLADFPYAIYTDALQNGFQDWSWAARDFNSTANVRQGDKSIKVTYGAGGYEGITFHNDGGPATGAYTKLEFSVFGEAGTAGKQLNVVINGNWGGPYAVTIVGGEWTTYSINLSALGNPSPLTEIILQSGGFSGVIHVDHVGLR